jgi:hypothetical protein
MLLFMTKRSAIIAGIFLILLAICSCERPTQAKLDGGNPPVFSIWSGTGPLWFFSIHEYRPDKSLKPSRRSHEIWRVEAARDSSGQLLGRYASDIGKVTYGIVPVGYTQVVPAAGNPPPLIEGKYYSYSFKAVNGMPADGSFEIRGASAVSVKLNDGCYYEKDGKEIEVSFGDSNDNSNR